MIPNSGCFVFNLASFQLERSKQKGCTCQSWSNHLQEHRSGGSFPYKFGGSFITREHNVKWTNTYVYDYINNMDVSENSGFSPQIIHLNRVFHYKSSILGYHYFWKHLYDGMEIVSAGGRRYVFFISNSHLCWDEWKKLKWEDPSNT